MILNELRVKNFMPFFGEQGMEFPVSSHQNVILVFGDNMRGKTSLLNAIRWAFYGRAIDRYRAEIPTQKLVNMDAASSGDWSMSVSVKFSHDAASYVLTRSVVRAKAVATPQRPEDFKEDVTLVKDGALQRADVVPHVINRIVPEQISRFFLFDGELLQEYESLLADDGEQGHRIKLAIEEALGVPSLLNGKEELRTLRRMFEKQQATDLRKDKNVERFIEDLHRLNKEYESLEADQSEVSAILAGKRKEYQELQQEIAASESRFAQKVDLDAKQQERKRLLAEIDSLEQQRLAATQDAWKDMLRPKMEQRRKELEAWVDEEDSRLRASTSTNELVAIRETAVSTGECPACLRQMVEKDIISLRELLASAQKSELDHKEAAIRVAELSRQARQISQVRYPGTKQQLRQIALAIRRLSVDETRVSGEIERLQEELAGFDTEDMSRVRKRAESTHHAVRQMEIKLDEVKRKLEKNLSQREATRLLINANTDARDQRSTRIVNLISVLESIFSKATERLRDDLRAEVESKATSAFRALTTEETYQGLRINENYGLRILDEKGREVGLRSAGAEQIVALSLIDGLNRTGRSAGPVVMDTPFGRLDPKHRSKVLAHLPEAAAQVVLFVHEGEVMKHGGFDAVASKVGAMYTIERVSSSQSMIKKDHG